MYILNVVKKYVFQNVDHFWNAFQTMSLTRHRFMQPRPKPSDCNELRRWHQTVGNLNTCSYSRCTYNFFINQNISTTKSELSVLKILRTPENSISRGKSWRINNPSFNSSPPSAAYMHQWIGSALVQIMACRLFGAKPLSAPMLVYCQLDYWEQTSLKF